MLALLLSTNHFPGMEAKRNGITSVLIIQSIRLVKSTLRRPSGAEVANRCHDLENAAKVSALAR